MPADSLTAHQFDDAAQQREAVTLGMWVFLATEVLFFGGMFLGYTVYRLQNPHAWVEASRHTLVGLGTLNTAILLCSSLTMVLGVQSAEQQSRLSSAKWLAITAALGVCFLIVKSFEYYHEIQEGLFPGKAFILSSSGRGAEMFFYLYFLMTGVHALHVIIGLVLLAIFALRLRRQKAASSHPSPAAVDALGLYWHFVDIVWVFLFPLIYLVGRHS
jgi:cytochrome c oxidase subunit 3